MLADAVSRLVLGKFSDLTDNFSSPHARRKVLAGVVMTTGKHVGGTDPAYVGPMKAAASPQSQNVAGVWVQCIVCRCGYVWERV